MSVSIQFVAHTVESPSPAIIVAKVAPATGEVRFWPAGVGHGPCIVMDGQDFDRLVAQVNASRKQLRLDGYTACEGCNQ